MLSGEDDEDGVLFLCVPAAGGVCRCSLVERPAVCILPCPSLGDR